MNGSPDTTYKEELFCEGYGPAGGNATRAAINAGYSSASAGAIAVKLMRKPHIQERIAQLQTEARIRNRIDGDALIISALGIATGEHSVKNTNIKLLDCQPRISHCPIQFGSSQRKNARACSTAGN